jgi:pyruvate dehydrogenase E1 component alpha subunit
MRGASQVAACFFGEGALGQGLLYETMNMASLWKLPVIYVCENNLYTEYTHYRETTAGEVRKRPEAFGLPADTVDGQDVLAVYRGMTRAVNRARAGEGPSFLECRTYRFHGHYVGDIDRAYYRTRQEEQEWISQRDPIPLLAHWLLREKLASSNELDEIRRQVEGEIQGGLAIALQAPLPSGDEVNQHVYC